MSDTEKFDLVEAIKRISPGQILCYHAGFLASDRNKHWINEAASAAWDAAQLGLGDLTQVRIGSFNYRYLITGRRKRGQA